MADQVIVITTTDVSAMRDAQRTAAELSAFPTGTVHLVVGRVSRKVLRALHTTIDDAIDAAGEVMLAPITGKGKKLFNAINAYRENILQYVTDPRQRKIIASNLSTNVPRKPNTLGKNWQEYMFEDMPVAAAVTLLSKLQNDVRYAEGEVLHTLVSNIDMKDIRVNKLSAFVVPEKTTLYPGERFSANIVMAAVDTTQQPEIYVNGSRVNTRNGQYSFTAGGVGEHQFSGYILMHNTKGDVLRRNFLHQQAVVYCSW